MSNALNRGSEVAHILAQIETEYVAATQGMSGFAVTARHKAITARMENLGRLHESLHALVGEEAIKLMAERLENVSVGKESEVQ